MRRFFHKIIFVSVPNQISIKRELHQQPPSYHLYRSQGFGNYRYSQNKQRDSISISNNNNNNNNNSEKKIKMMQLTFTSIPSLQVDMGVESQIESFLKKQQQSMAKSSSSSESMKNFPTIRIINVPKSTLKRAILDFYIGNRSVRAIGQSTRTKKARALCCMHAAKLIDHFSIEGSENSTAPLPLEEEISSFNNNNNNNNNNMNSREISNQQGRIISRQRSSSSSPHPEEYNNWEDYIRDSEKYIAKKEEMKRYEAYIQMRIPPSGNEIVDRAANITEQERGTNRFALQQLNNEILGATKDMNVTRVAPKVFVASLILDRATNITAIGVATNSKEAKQRVAMHALNILKLVKEQRQENVSENIGGINALGQRGSCASKDALSLSLSPRYSKMLDFFTLLFGITPNPKFSKEGNSYTCEIELDGIKCLGNGINRFEAERNAIENVLAEMELYDERLQGINSILSRYPNILPQSIPTANLPESLRNEIHSFVEKCHIELNNNDNLSHNNNYNENNTMIDSDDVVDVETRKTIKALEEVQPNEAYAKQLRDHLCSLRADPIYLERFHPRRSTLSIAGVQERILETLNHHRVIVVCGTTGCGKTTQVPQYIFDNEIMCNRGDRCCIVITQPRRISAFSIAEYIARERLESVGKDVGYAVRLDARPGKHITLCTTGVLLQMLIGMPSLDAVSHLIIDEVHERDINCDVVLALVKQLLESQNKKIKIILMSATMQSDKFSKYFGNVPVISVDGALFPVKERYLEDIANSFQESSSSNYYSPMFDSLNNNSRGTQSNFRRRGNENDFRSKKRLVTIPLKTDYGLIAQLIERSVKNDLQNNVIGKSILVFLPGWKELIAAKQAIENLSNGQKYHIILLHSSVDAAKQRECFAPAPEGRIKVVLATNIAESGITIDDAAIVIDTGLIKQTTWISRVSSSSNSSSFINDNHASSYATQLALQYASRANCTQRKGRAGRTQGGICYRLFTREVWDALPSFQEAEIHRVPLTQVLLKLFSLGHIKPKETLRTFIEPPSERNVEASMKQLQSLGAVTGDEKLTPLGLYLSRLPCDPRVGKMIMMGAVLRCLDSALTMAATEDISPFVSSREVSFEVRQRRHILSMGSQSDHISVLNAYNALCVRHGDSYFAHENYLHLNNMRLISRYKQQYRDILRRSGFIRNEELDNVDFYEDEFMMYDNEQSLYVDSGPLSQDADDVTLVKACLCAALFPNVAVLDPTPLLHGEKKIKKLIMRTPTQVSISPSKDSACRRLGPPRSHGVQTSQEFFNNSNINNNGEIGNNMSLTPSMFYIYQNIFGLKESKEEFLTQVSSVSLWALLLFGVGEADMRFDEKLNLCILSGWIGIHIDSKSFAALQALRLTLHTCVWRKYKKPDDNENNKALEILRRLCKEVLKSPPNDKEQHINRLVDTGHILSPIELQAVTGEPSDSDDGES